MERESALTGNAGKLLAVVAANNVVQAKNWASHMLTMSINHPYMLNIKHSINTKTDR